jgi:hypothetical protein
MTTMRSTTRILALAPLALLLLTTAAQAGNVLASGPLRIAANSYYHCTAVNVGPTPIARIDVAVTIPGSTPGSGVKESCTAVDSNTICEGENQAGGANFRFCTVTVTGNRKNVKASFCDTTAGICIPVQ